MERLQDSKINISQTQVAQDIINKAKLPPNTTTRYTLVIETMILQYDDSAPNIDKSFHNCGVIEWMKFVKKITRPDISYVTHQYAQL